MNQKVIVKLIIPHKRRFGSPKATTPKVNLKRQAKSQLPIWNNCNYEYNNDIKSCDYLVLMDISSSPVFYSDTIACPKNHTIFVTHDPESIKRYSRKYLSQFEYVISPQPNLKHHNIIRTHQILPWYMNKTYDELIALMPMNKTKMLSVITSNKRYTKGHEIRYEFVMRLKKYFSDEIDLFGRGINSFDDKWDVLSPYKYTIAIENTNSKDNITEKLTDCFLSYTYPYYYGCPNVEDYYPPGSFQYIDISDIEGTIEIIQRDLNDPEHYKKHLKDIIEARNRYLNEYQLFPALTNIINQIDDGNKNKISMDIHSQKYEWSYFYIRVASLSHIIKYKLLETINNRKR